MFKVGDPLRCFFSSIDFFVPLFLSFPFLSKFPWRYVGIHFFPVGDVDVDRAELDDIAV